MKSRIVAIFALLVVLGGSALAQKVNVDWDRGTNFSQFKTYAWQPSPDPASGLWDQRIIDGLGPDGVSETDDDRRRARRVA